MYCRLDKIPDDVKIWIGISGEKNNSTTIFIGSGKKFKESFPPSDLLWERCYDTIGEYLRAYVRVNRLDPDILIRLHIRKLGMLPFSMEVEAGEVEAINENVVVSIIEDYIIRIDS